MKFIKYKEKAHSLKLIVFFAIIGVMVTGCASGESLLVSKCTKDGMPKAVCECSYKNLKSRYNDGEIKSNFNEMLKIEAKGSTPTDISPATRQFIVDLGQSFGACIGG